MAWTTVPGLAGKVYLPDEVGQTQKKHPCKGCFSCQWCDESRCQVCRNDDTQVSISGSTKYCSCRLSKLAKANRP